MEEKGIIIQQSVWDPVKAMLNQRNNGLVCKDGDSKSNDFSKLRSYCYYPDNCMSLALQSLFITLPGGKQFEIVKSQYLMQKTTPSFRCEIMIQALPDSYLNEMNEIEMIIGQPLLFNYYSIFDVQEGRVGLYEASYTRTQRQVTIGAVLCFGLFTLICGCGVVAGIAKCQAQAREPEPTVNAREKREANQRKQLEAGEMSKSLVNRQDQNQK